MVYGQVSALNRTQKRREKKRKYMEERYKIPSVRARMIESEKKLRIKRGTNKNTCSILKRHHEAMKSDPEHLTTAFIKKLIKVDCKDI